MELPEEPGRFSRRLYAEAGASVAQGQEPDLSFYNVV